MKDTLKELVSYLKQQGFPESSLAIGWTVGKQKIDLAVLDNITKEPIAVFIIIEDNKCNETNLILPSQRLTGSNIPVYFVFAKDGTPSFEVLRFNNEKKHSSRDLPRMNAENILSYSTLKESGRNAVIERKKRERKSAFDLFQLVCWILALLIVPLIVLDIYKVISISGNQLTLIGIVVVLVLVPFASRIRILGIEFERLIKENNAD